MMRNRRHHAFSFAGLVLVGFLAGCGTAKPPPPWQAKTISASDAAVSAYLQGQVKISAIQMKQAQFSASSTGRPDAVYKLNLLQCALDISSLSATLCPRPEDVGIRSDSFDPVVRLDLEAYRAYLLGDSLDETAQARLPETQRAAAALAGTTDGADALKVLVAIEEPLSRLVAAGVWLRRQDLASSGQTGVIALAIDTASQQGWRRPLAAWLTRQIRVAQAAGDTATVQRAHARLAIVLDGVSQE